MRVPPTEVVTVVARRHADRDHRRDAQADRRHPAQPARGLHAAPARWRRCCSAAARWSSEDTIDWGMGETLAFGSLLIDGHPVRLVGQDSRRGTFGQRHAVLVDRVTGEEHTPLKTFNEGTTKFYVYDSLLSEFAAMGFEYGYSWRAPTRWCCGRRSSATSSTAPRRSSTSSSRPASRSGASAPAVVLLLPHGYEGQGPDHSSARIERFLQLCAQDNMTVAQPDHPGELLPPAALAGGRPAGTSRWSSSRPKSLLRHKAATSKAADFTSRHLPAGDRRHHGRPRRGHARSCSAPARSTTTCSPGGRSRAGTTSRSSVSSGSTRCPAEELNAELARYGAQSRADLGAGRADQHGRRGRTWRSSWRRTRNCWAAARCGASRRPANSSPAAGSHAAHDAELEEILKQIFG